MPQSLVKNYLHITFSTKGRYPFIDKTIANELYAYLAEICKKGESYPVEIGGTEDHVHILCLLSRKTTLMKLVEELKSYSSKWIKGKGIRFKDFYWQNGYGGFSVNPSQVETVRRYILNQEKHHRQKNFQEEYRAFLNKYHVEYDERFVWD
jgi:REP element-mobilizing transposase RayT